MGKAGEAFKNDSPALSRNGNVSDEARVPAFVQLVCSLAVREAGRPKQFSALETRIPSAQPGGFLFQRLLFSEKP